MPSCGPVARWLLQQCGPCQGVDRHLTVLPLHLLMSRQGRVILIVIVALLGGALLFRVRGVLTPFYLGAAIAYVSNPLVNLLQRKQVPRSLAILLVYAMFGVFVLLAVYSLLPSLSRELDEIAAVLPEQTKRLEGIRDHAFRDLRKLWLPETLQEIFNLTLRRTEDLLGRFAGRVAEVIVGLVSQLFNLILAPFLAYYLLRDLDLLRRVAISWLPGGVRRDAVELARRVNRVVGRFIRGQLIVSIVVGLLIAAGLALLKVRYALVIGLFAGLADIIPYFGPILSAIPAVALGLVVSPVTAVWVIILLVAVQQFEGSVLSPKIMGEQVGLHPLTVIFAVLAGGDMLGIVGMLLAVPVAATLKVIGAYIGERILAS